MIDALNDVEEMLLHRERRKIEGRSRWLTEEILIDELTPEERIDHKRWKYLVGRLAGLLPPRRTDAFPSKHNYNLSQTDRRRNVRIKPWRGPLHR